MESSGDQLGAIDVDKSYRILDRVVHSGFDYIGVRLLGRRYVLKTLTSSEEEAIRLRTFGTDALSDSCWVLAFGTYMLDRKDCLQDRWTSSALDDLFDMYSKLPFPVVTTLYDVLLKLTRRLDKAYNLLHGWLYTSNSRFKWQAYRSSGCRWGIDTRLDHAVGSCLARDYWVRGNNAMDVEEALAPSWDQAIYIASSQNPKGAKDSSSKMTGKRQIVEDERRALSLYGSAENRDKILEVSKKEIWTAPLVTQEDILAELFRQMRGERDKHDLFVAQYMKEKANKHAAEQALKAAQQEEYRRMLKATRKPREEGQREASAEEVMKLEGVSKKSVSITGKRVIGGRR